LIFKCVGKLTLWRIERAQNSTFQRGSENGQKSTSRLGTVFPLAARAWRCAPPAKFVFQRTPGPVLGGWVRVLWLGAPEQPSLWGAGDLGRWEFRKGCGPPLRRDLSFLEAENGCFVYRFFFQPHTKRELLGWVRFRDAWHLGFFAGFRDV